MLTLEFLGQACTAIKCHRTGVEIVSDPWFSGPAHLNSWCAFPSWSKEELEHIRRRIDLATHIYLSHDHQDHFDPEFLSTLGRKQILVGDFQNERFKARLRELSALHDICHFGHGQSIAINESVSAQIFMQQPAFRTDSMMLFSSPDGVILNANDCGLDTSLLRGVARRRPVTVFMYTLNFMANGYPISYLFGNDPTFDARMKEVRDQTVDSFRLALAALQPAAAAAFAGPVTYGDSFNNHLNAHPESCDWRLMVEEVRQAFPLMWPAPFSTIECIDEQIAKSDIKDWDWCQPSSEPVPLPAETVELTEILSAAGSYVANQAATLEELGEVTNTRLVLSAVGSLDAIESMAPLWSVELDFANRTVRQVDSPQAPYLEITTVPEILRDFLCFKINIDDILLSARARFRRDPDSFDPILHNVMRYGGDPLARTALARWTRRRATCKVSLTVEFDGEKRRIPKFCPHEGENLEGAPIVDGKLICPRHRWTFDMNTGQCIAGDQSVNLYTLVDQQSSALA